MADLEVDYRTGLPAVARQGLRPTCVAFAATAGHESILGLSEDLAEEFLHWAAKQRDGLPPGGTTLQAAGSALAFEGQPVESMWPYDPRQDEADPGYAPTPLALADAATRRLLLGQPVTPDYPTVRATVDAVAGPYVLVGVDLHDGWGAVGADAIIPYRQGPGIGGHGVLVAGYREDAIGSYLLIRNSWGEAWGDSGYAYLSAADFDEHAISAWSMVVP